MLLDMHCYVCAARENLAQLLAVPEQTLLACQADNERLRALCKSHADTIIGLETRITGLRAKMLSGNARQASLDLLAAGTFKWSI